MPDGPLSLYRRRLDAGEISHDPAQELAAEKLAGLYHALKGYKRQATRPARGFLGFLKRSEEAQAQAPAGLYLYGGVGRGKSMLMDLFYETAPVEPKRRVHFHAFMQEIHARLHALRQEGRPDGRGADPRAERRPAADPLPLVAEAVAEEAALLCFDEFVVNNIADAMILGRLFEQLFERGVIVVATSNFAPDDLYKDGLQRDRFLPFIALIKQRMDMLELESPTDYRMVRLRGVPVYHTPLGPESRAELERAFRRVADGESGQPETVSVLGRSLAVPRAANGVAWFTFADLCERPLGSADYLALAGRYHTVILDGVPLLTPEKRNEARRLMVLIDALYEHRVTLICAAEAPPHHLYPAGEGAFEFMRTVSRMVEMQAEDYQAKPHIKAASAAEAA